MIKNVLKKLTVFDDQIDKELLNGEEITKKHFGFSCSKAETN